MALSKIIAEGVDLTDTFAFTGTVTGAGLTSPFGNTVTVTSEGGAATTNLVQGLAKSWINWNGQGTIAVQDSLNNSSISDNGTGDYTVTVASAMSNVSYCRSGMCGMNASSQENIAQAQNSTPATTTSGRYNTTYADTVNEDVPYAGVVLQGDLA